MAMNMATAWAQHGHSTVAAQGPSVVNGMPMSNKAGKRRARALAYGRSHRARTAEDSGQAEVKNTRLRHPTASFLKPLRWWVSRSQVQMVWSSLPDANIAADGCTASAQSSPSECPYLET